MPHNDIVEGSRLAYTYETVINKVNQNLNAYNYQNTIINNRPSPNKKKAYFHWTRHKGATPYEYMYLIS